MKSKLVVAVILSFILVGIAAASYAEGALSLSPPTFTLTAYGKAYDPRHHQYVAVSLSLRGTRAGKLSSTMLLYVSGGSLIVQNFGTFPVPRGYGTLVQRCHYIQFTLKITSKYGERVVIWYLRGKTGSLAGNTMPVSFYSYRVVLPMSGSPLLYYFNLKGTLTLN